MKKVTKLQKKVIWWKLFMQLKYRKMFETKVVKQEYDKLKYLLDTYGAEGWQCVHVRPYPERNEKEGGFTDMVEVYFQREVFIGIDELQGRPTEKEKDKLII